MDHRRLVGKDTSSALRRIVCAAGIWAAVSAMAGCATSFEDVGTASAPLTARELTISLPAGVDPQAVALGASEKIVLADRTEVREPSGGISTITSVGSGTTEVGAAAFVGRVWSRGNIFLRSRANVSSSIKTKGTVTEQDNVTHGTVEYNATFDPVAKAGWIVSIPSTVSGDIQTEPDQTVSKTPGRYNVVSVKSRSRLKLSPGVYIFDQLMLEPQSIIELDQSSRLTEIYVLSVLTVRGDFKEKAGRLPFPIVGYWGQNAAYIEKSYRGAILAPNAKLVLGANSPTDFAGTFFAGTIETRPDTYVTHRSFNIPSSTGSGQPTGPVLRDFPTPVTTPAADCGPRKGLAVSAWPMRGYCNAHLGQSPFLGTRTSFQRWSFLSDAAISAQPIIGPRSTAYFGTVAGTLYAVSKDGIEVWHQALGASISGSPAISNQQVVYVGADDGKVRAFDRFGVSKWTTDLSSYGDQTAPAWIRTSPAIGEDGAIYVGTSRGVIVALNKDGTVRWTTVVSGAVSASTGLDGGDSLYAVTESGNAYALAQATGAIRWTKSGFGVVQASPTVGRSDRLYIASGNGNLYATKATTGDTVWALSCGAGINAPPAIAANGNLFIGTSLGRLLVSTPAGQIAWSTDLTSAITGTPAISADSLGYVSVADGRTVAVRIDTGAILWTHQANSAVSAGPSIDSSGQVLVGTNGGELVRIGSDPHDGIGLTPGTGTAGQRGPSPFGGNYDPSNGNSPTTPTGAGGGAGFGSEIGFVPQFDTTFSSAGNGDPEGPSLGFPNGQESCGTGTSGLGGLKYDPLTQELDYVSVTPPSNGADCNLKFCNDDENPISLSIGELNTNPNTLPTPTKCEASGVSRHCPLDPTSAGAECKSDAECDAASQEKCGVFCDTAACETYRYRCGKPLYNCDQGLGEEPAGPYDPSIESTWPCQEHRECAETTPGISYTGEPDLGKTGFLEEKTTPDPVRVAPTPLAKFPSVSSTVYAGPCAAPSKPPQGESNIDPRSGGSGNDKWGVFIEPQINYGVEVKPGNFFGDGAVSGQAGASLVAGANVWGKRLEVVNAKLSASLSACSYSTTKSFKVLNKDYLSAGDSDPTSEPSVGQRNACAAAISERAKLANAMTKALRDAKAAADFVNRHGVTSAFCARTATVFGSAVDPSCTTASLQRWLNEYRDRANDLQTFHFGDYSRALADLETEAEVPIGRDDTQFTGLGAAVTFPIGPITVEMEIEVAGLWGIGGKLSYGMVSPVSDSASGPYARAEFSPHASAMAFVYIGAGIGGVTVGVFGELELLSFSTPLFAGFNLSRGQFYEFRDLAPSGLFGAGSNQSLFDGRGVTQWRANTTYGAGLELSTLSGQVDLAVRIRLLFFKKTFRKKIAKWKGYSKRFEFVGQLNSPTEKSNGYDYSMSTVPYPAADNLSVFSEGDLQPEVPLSELGPANFPGQCGTPPACIAGNDRCQRNDQCCNSACVEYPDGYRCWVTPIIL